MINNTIGGRYKILRKIGSGGMATVYEARCGKLDRLVAVKILKEEFEKNSDFLVRFQRESQAVAKLSHPNIVSVYDVGEEHDRHYIVMELVNGVTLKEYIKNNIFLAPKEALHIAHMICQALQHAHKHGIIHRDVKPHNVLITNDNFVKMSDFGIAYTVTDATVIMDKSTNLGSVHYMSPEQSSSGYVDELSDIYSLGVVMYEMLTGQVPFDGENAISIAIKHSHADFPSMEFKNVPIYVENIVKKAMNKQKSARYQSINEMLNDIYKVQSFLNCSLDNTSKNHDQETMPVIENKLIENKLVANKLYDDRTDIENGYERKQKSQKSRTSKIDKFAGFGVAVASLLLVAVIGFSVAYILFPGLLNKEKEVVEVVVPQVVGQMIETVKNQYQNDEKIKIIIQDEAYDNNYEKGRIISQSPLSGKTVVSPINIEVIVSRGKQEIMLPDYTGKSKGTVLSELAKSSISATIIEQNSDSVPEGYVIKTSPAGGNVIQATGIVTVYVSKGIVKEVQVPQLVGLNIETAKSFVTQSSLVIGTVSEIVSNESKNTVIQQSIAPYQMVKEFSNIDICVSKGIENNDAINNIINQSLKNDTNLS